MERVAPEVERFVVVELDGKGGGEAAHVVENGGDAGEVPVRAEGDAEAVHAVLRGDVEGCQAVFERPAAGFDERLLDAPDADKSLVFFAAGQVHDDGVLLGGEVVSGQQVDVVDRSYPLDVDAGFGVS